MTNIFQQRYYRINKRLLTIIGQWPYQSRSTRFGLLALFLFLATSQIIPQIIAVLEFWHDPDVIVESIPPFVIDLACFTKLANIVINSDKMHEMFNRIKIDWDSVEKQPEINLLREYGENGRRFTIAYAVGVYIVTFLFLTQPVAPKLLADLTDSGNETQTAKYPFPVDYYGIDLNTYYYYFIVHSYISVTAILTVVVAADTMFIVQVQHACGMFTVVGNQLQRMANEVPDARAIYSCPRDDPAFRHLTYCIRKHKDVIEFSELLEASYTWAFFSIVGFNMVVMSITGLETVLKMDECPQEAIRYAAFTLAQLAHLFFQSFFSQRLMDHSQEIREYLCQAEWYRTSLYAQKLLNPITMRTRLPCQLTAGNFLVMSLENFSSIVKTSMSYFTLLRSMK